MKYLVGASTDAPWYVVPAANADGVTDDTVALQAALDTGLDVMLVPGKTYIVNGSLRMSAQGQTLYLNSATLKRLPQVFSTLTANATAGAAAKINVADASVFKVGMAVCVIGSGPIQQLYVTNPGSGYTSAPTVAISGNATATCSVDAGGAQRVVSTTLTGAGSGYITQPTITLTDGGGTGAALKARINANAGDVALKIIAITGNTLTLESSLTVAQPAGAVVYSCGFAVEVDGTDIAILGPGVIDGNKANFTYYRWESTAAIRIKADRCRVQHVHVMNEPGEGMYISNTSYTTIADCVLENLNGNGLHFSNSPNPQLTPPGGHIVVSRCRVFNCNLDPAVDHPDGGIIWSDNILDATITECKVDTTPLYGIGAIDSTGNSDVTLSGNTFVNCLAGGINMDTGQNASAPARVTVTGNRFRNCGNCQNVYNIDIRNTGSLPTVFPSDITVSGNQIDATGSISPGVSVQQCRQVVVTGNVIRGPTNGANNAAAIVVKDAKYCSITGNAITGYTRGINFQGTTAQNVSISGNNMTNIHTAGIQVLTGLGQNINITGNVIDGDGVTTSTYTGIILGDACCCSGNSIFVANGSASIGISVTGSNNTVTGNQIRGAASQPKTGIVTTALTTGNVIAGNSISSTAVAQITLNGTTINDVTPGSGNYQTA